MWTLAGLRQHIDAATATAYCAEALFSWGNRTDRLLERSAGLTGAKCCAVGLGAVRWPGGSSHLQLA